MRIIQVKLLLNIVLHKSTYYDLTDISLAIIDKIYQRFNDDLEESKKVFYELLNRKGGKQGYVAIHYASYRGNVELIKKFISLGADYKLLNNEGLNVLHMAAQGNQPASLVYFVEEKQMDLKLKDHVGSTPLHWACYIGAENAIDFILSNNIEINAQDNEGFTPLHLAVLSG
jgi:palmitoyltransferase